MSDRSRRIGEHPVAEEKITLTCKGPDGRVKWKQTILRRPNPLLERLAQTTREVKPDDH